MYKQADIRGETSHCMNLLQCNCRKIQTKSLHVNLRRENEREWSVIASNINYQSTTLATLLVPNIFDTSIIRNICEVVYELTLVYMLQACVDVVN